MLRRTVLISAVVALAIATSSAKGMYGNSRGHHKNNSNVTNNSVVLPTTELTEAQKEDLVYMLEEEKIARDVYSTLYDVYGSRIFKNIIRSEERHVDAVKSLVEKYGVEAPATLYDEGVFENEELQELYDSLVAKGKSSLTDALKVGVEIEELDISDIENILNAGVPEDFERVYENLLNGSYNHLNAFNRQLARQ